jgi:hypothetical protein
MDKSVDQLSYSVESIKLKENIEFKEIKWEIQIEDEKPKKSYKLVVKIKDFDQESQELLSKEYEKRLVGVNFFLIAEDYQRFSKDLKNKKYSMENNSYLDKGIAVILSYEKICDNIDFIRTKNEYNGCWENNNIIKDLRACLYAFQNWERWSINGAFYVEISSLIEEKEVQEVKTTHKYLLDEPFYINSSKLYQILGLDGKAVQKYILEPFYKKLNRPKSPTKQEAGRKERKALDHGISNEKLAFETFISKLDSLKISQCVQWDQKESKKVVIHREYYVENIPCVENKVTIIVKPDATGKRDTEEFPIEFKCPYSKKAEREYIIRYYLQVQCQIQALDAKLAYFVIWTVDETQIYEIQRDDHLWNDVKKILLNIYENFPPSITDEKENTKLKSLVTDSWDKNSKLLAESN